MSTKERYERVRAEVDLACEKAGRNPHEVLLLAVSKTVDLDQVQEAIEGGAHAFGENRPDGLLEKATAFPQATWHFIGNIQSRRIPDIVRSAALVHSLFEERHARKIDEAAAAAGKVQDVLLEVNVSGEESKGGLPMTEVYSVAEAALGLPNVRVRGLMTIPPVCADPRESRPYFEKVRALSVDINEKLFHNEFKYLSMGMSGDFEEAIRAGATMVRVGTAIFGARNYGAAT